MPLTMIGDVDQMLFRFAGARPEIMSRELERYFPDLETFKLETNYRSVREIIDRSTDSIAFNYSVRGGPYSQDLFKLSNPRDNAEDGVPISFVMFDEQEEESEYVAQTIETLVDSGAHSRGDFFVGSRTRAQLGYIEGSLTRRGIKYVNLAGGCFWSSKHIKDVISYVRLAYDNTDEDAFKRVYNIASRWFTAPFGSQKGEYINHRYLGRAFLDEVRSSYANTTHVNWRYRAGVEDLRKFVTDVSMALDGSGIAGALDFVVDNCYLQWIASEEGLLNTDESENGKLDDLRTAIEIAKRFESAKEFFDYVEEMEKAADEAKNGDHSKLVVISTVHRLKGKERPVVFGIGVCEGTSEYGPKKQPAGLLPHTFSLINPPKFGVLPTGGKGRVEDERCVFFVLISRAKESVYLSGFRYFKNYVMGPSRFVSEIGLAEHGLAEQEQPLEMDINDEARAG